MPDHITWNPKAEIAVPAPEREKRLAIRQVDWDRLRRSVANQQSSRPSLSIAYSILFGVGGSSGFSIIPLAYTEKLGAWVIPTYVLVTVFSVLVAFILMWLEKRMNKNATTQSADLARDMEEIEKMFQPE
jgi:hypothetical protein